MKKTATRAKELLSEYRRLFRTLPNLRYFVAACASESERPRWIQDIMDAYKVGKVRESIERIEQTRDELFSSVLDLVGLAFAEQDIRKRKRLLRRFEEGFDEVVKEMRATGVSPKPFAVAKSAREAIVT